MKGLAIRLAFALVFALVAGLVSFSWQQSAKEKYENCEKFIVVSEKIAKGTAFSDKSGSRITFAKLTKYPDSFPLREKYMLYNKDNRALLNNLPAPRDYERGEMIELRDLRGESALPQYRVLGPFRLLKIAEEGGTVKVAVKYERKGDAYSFDDATRRLLQIVLERGSAESDMRLLTPVFFPRAESKVAGSKAESERADELGDNEIGLLVSVPNVSELQSLTSDQYNRVGFVVPESLLTDEELKNFSNLTDAQKSVLSSFNGGRNVFGDAGGGNKISNADSETDDDSETDVDFESDDE